MNEIILEIKKTSFRLGECRCDKDEGCYCEYDGYVITTNKQTIKVGISNYQECCEDWGYFISEDNINDFIGANLLDIKIIDETLQEKDLKKTQNNGKNLYNCMFVNLHTNNGLLQFVAYNDNAIYGHEAVLVSAQLNESIHI